MTFVFLMILSSAGFAAELTDAGAAVPYQSGDEPMLRGLIISDAHIGMPLSNGNVPFEAKQAAMEHMRARFPDLDMVLDTGDAYHGSLGCELTREAQKKWFDVFSDPNGRASFFYIPGNHEIVAGEGFDPEADCADMGSMAARPYYSFDIKGIHFVCLPQLEHPCYTSKETMDWFRVDLDLNRGKTTVILCHNNLEGTTALDEYMRGYRTMTNTRQIVDLLKNYPNVVAWMHGHNHDYAVVEKYGFLNVSNGRIGGFNPTRANVHGVEGGEPLGGIYFEVTTNEFRVKCYSADDQLFLAEVSPNRAYASRTVYKKTSLNPDALMEYAFGHGGFTEGQRSVAFNHYTSAEGGYSMILAGASDPYINENNDFSLYVHRADNPKFKQWALFGYEVGTDSWPRYFEEENNCWRWLNPGVELLACSNPVTETTSLFIPGRPHEQFSYYRAVPGKSYDVSVRVASTQGGQAAQFFYRVFDQNGKKLWEYQEPDLRELPPGESLLRSKVVLPALDQFVSVYTTEAGPELQLGIELRFSNLSSPLVLKRADVSFSDAEEITRNPSLTLGSQVFHSDAALAPFERVEFSMKPPEAGRLAVAARCAGSGRMIWYCRQTGIDWQVRNAPVTDHGTYLQTESLRNAWNETVRVVISPSAGVKDSAYVRALKNIQSARIYPLNRGNERLKVDVLKCSGSGEIEVYCTERPDRIEGTETWNFSNGVISIPVAEGSSVQIIAGSKNRDGD
jgi:hypothetical protein